jgi:hypothetical protein
MHHSLRKAGLAVAGSAALAAVGLAGAAGASATTAAPVTAAPATVVNGPNYNGIEVGYEQQSSTPKNSMRGTVCIPAGSKVSQAVGFQQNVNGGPTYALALVYDPSATPEAGFILAELTGTLTNFQTGTPLGSVSGGSFTPVASLSAPAGHELFTPITGGCYYVEVRLSTHLHVVNFIAGPSEDDAATLGFLDPGVPGDGFTAPFVAGADFMTGLLPPSTPLASWTRMGTTTASDGTRVTFDASPLDLTESIEKCFTVGCMPAIADPVTMLPDPALPGVGSAWTEESGS